MASADYPYPSDLDSDGAYGSDQYSDCSDDDDSFMGTPGRAPSSRHSSTTSHYTTVPTCVVCRKRPPYFNSRTGQSYPTCGLTCAAILSQQGRNGPPASTSSRITTFGPPTAYPRPQRTVVGALNTAGLRGGALPIQPKRLMCVVCKKGWSHRKYVTCGITCAEKLSKGGGDPSLCTYCYRKPKHQGHDQCGNTCAAKAKVACLLCKSRPKNGAKYHLCGKICKSIAMKSTPMILEAPKGHETYEMAEKKFQKAWHPSAGPIPAIQKIFKIIENDGFLKPYAVYKQKVGNEHFRYHGTGRQCQLGVTTTQLCTSAACPVCSILKTSFKVSMAKQGTFGAGVYSSSASNMAHAFCGGARGSMLVAKVVLGKVSTATAGIPACPAGFDSVTYDTNGPHNETIVYTDDAIRPVFLIAF